MRNVFQKHYKFGVLKGVHFSDTSKNRFTNCELVCHKNAFFQQFVSQTPIFLQKSVFFENARSCARFFGFANWANMVHTGVSQLKQNKKKLWSHYFSVGIWVLLLSNKNQFLLLGLSAPNRAIWLRLWFVIRIANRKSLGIWNTVDLPRKAHCSDYLCRKAALRF